MTTRKTLTLHGDRIHDIASFYDEINRVLMVGEDWTLAPSLDALDDLLYGSYGVIAGNEPVVLAWHDFERSREALGLHATRQLHLHKLQQPQRYDTSRIQDSLARLDAGDGETYFDIVLGIIASHPNIELVTC